MAKLARNASGSGTCAGSARSRGSTALADEDDERGPGLRRILLPRSGYHVYYRVREGQRRVDVLSFWHARRLPPAL